MRDKKYLFSVIMPVYNVEKYLEEAIESVINQDIEFENKIQLILVNDGSTDNSEEICLKYKSRFPSDIIYVKKANGGVSSARNEGIKHISGRYVNFFDADDKWDSCAFRIAFDYFEKHYDEVDVISGRHCFFGRREGFKHKLDYKYKEEKIVDVKKTYSYIQMHTNNTFIKAAALQGKCFDEKIKIAEDTKFITDIILEKEKYGIVPTVIYHYRKREERDSAVDLMKDNKSWYIDTIENYSQNMINYSVEKYGRIIPYIQYQILYEFQNRLKAKKPVILTEEEFENYKKQIVNLLGSVSNKVILKHRSFDLAYKIFILRLKNGEGIKKRFAIKENFLTYKDIAFLNLDRRGYILIKDLYINENTLTLYGEHKFGCLGSGFKVFVKDNKGKSYAMEEVDVSVKDKFAFDGTNVTHLKGFRTTIPLNRVKKISFYLKDRNKTIRQIMPAYGKFAKITSQIGWHYSSGKYIIKDSDGELVVLKSYLKRRVLLEAKYCFEVLWKEKQYYYLFLRLMMRIRKLISSKEIWIISDRPDVAGDNGEVFFTYLNNIEHDKNVYFAIEKDSADYERMKKIGKVLKLNSFMYHLCFLCADKIISSNAERWVTNPFEKDWKYVKDICSFDYVFLTQGVISNDLSSWLHRYNKRISLFLSSSIRERDAIVNGKYAYTDSEVCLTGLPRYDRLSSCPQKKIAFLPTYRKKISRKPAEGSTVIPYLETFKDTEYFRFYNTLINDSRITGALKEFGYEAEFYNHPNFSAQNVDFDGNETVKIMEKADYANIFQECALVITDYSSVAFDFAYLKKPVVYCQFDSDTFYNGQVYTKGYFDFEKDGFGPVCYNYEDAVASIVRYIQDGCVMEENYKERVDAFFVYADKNNCKRVYDAILQK